MIEKSGTKRLDNGGWNRKVDVQVSVADVSEWQERNVGALLLDERRDLPKQICDLINRYGDIASDDRPDLSRGLALTSPDAPHVQALTYPWR